MAARKGYSVTAVAFRLRPVLRPVLLSSALALVLVGLSACVEPAQKVEPEVTPPSDLAPSRAVPQIDSGAPADLETASFAMG